MWDARAFHRSGRIVGTATNRHFVGARSSDNSFSGGVWCTTIAADCRSSECRAAHSGGSGQSSIQGKRMTRPNTLLLAAPPLLVLGTGSAPAQEVKVSVNLPYTGIGA